MTTNRPLQVFLCHSSNDKPAVRELYQKLRAEAWIQPWLDEEELYPGQDWNMEIEQAVEAADAIIVCLTKNSINKEGYVQRELRIVLDFADYGSTAVKRGQCFDKLNNHLPIVEPIEA